MPSFYQLNCPIFRSWPWLTKRDNHFFNYIHMPPAELIRAVSYLLSLDRQFWHTMFSAA